MNFYFFENFQENVILFFSEIKHQELNNSTLSLWILFQSFFFKILLKKH